MTTTCTPDRPLFAVRLAMTSVCKKCDAPMERRWTPSGFDHDWRGTDGSSFGGKSPIEGVNGLGDYITYLRDNNHMAEYSFITARGGSLAPWEHWHTAVRPAPAHAPGEGPECCGRPMHLVRDGWRCRESQLLFPVQHEEDTGSDAPEADTAA